MVVFSTYVSDSLKKRTTTILNLFQQVSLHIKFEDIFSFQYAQCEVQTFKRFIEQMEPNKTEILGKYLL